MPNVPVIGITAKAILPPIYKVPDGKLLSIDNKQRQLWQRPGKDKGISATFNFIPNKFYPFSTNAYPFDSCRTYDKFAVHTILKHHGNFSASAKELFKEGYGVLGDNGNGQKQTENSQVQTDVAVKPRKNKKGIFVLEIQKYLTEKYILRKNIILAKNEYLRSGTWEEVNDTFVNEIWRQFQLQDKKVPLSDIRTVLESDFVKGYHPFKEYFNNLPRMGS